MLNYFSAVYVCFLLSDYASTEQQNHHTLTDMKVEPLFIEYYSQLFYYLGP